jgi:GGDEF domain-containing protein
MTAVAYAEEARNRGAAPEGLTRWVTIPAVALLALLVLRNAIDLGASGYSDLFDLGIHCPLMLLGAGLCLARARLYAAERLAWLFLGLALVASTLGDTLEFALYGEQAPPVPSVSDIFWLAYYPLAVLGLALLVGARFPQPEPSRWLEGVQAAMLVAAVGLMSVFYPTLAHIGGNRGEVVIDLAYPVLDIVLIGGVLAALTLSGFRPGASWLVLGAGLALFSLADAAWAIQMVLGTYQTGIVDAGWPASHLLIGYAAWMAYAHPPRVGSDELRTAVMPGAVVLISIGIQLGAVFGLLASGIPVARGFVIGAQVLLLAKILANPRAARRSSRTDALTGVGNRRALASDLDGLFRRSGRVSVLMLCELRDLEAVARRDGRDARDALLITAAHALRQLEGATTYRTDGGDFWLLAPSPPGTPAELAAATTRALAGAGAPAASLGAVVVPEEAADAAGARSLAERRLRSPG